MNAEPIVPSPAGDADIATVAALIGEPARARVLMGLLDGRSLAASVLAAEAGVSPSTMSEHLARLVAGDLIVGERQGRSRYYRLATPQVAAAMESLAQLAPAEPIASLRQGTHAHAIRRARTCYRHLAGRLGVALLAGMLRRQLLTRSDGVHGVDRAQQDALSTPGSAINYALTRAGQDELTDLGVDLDSVLTYQSAIRYCVDWSEQRHHLAGRLGSAITDQLFKLEWMSRARSGRAVHISATGREGLRARFGVDDSWDC